MKPPIHKLQPKIIPSLALAAGAALLAAFTAAGGAKGDKAGTVSAFPYSDAVKKSALVWNELVLDKWLTDPESVIPEQMAKPPNLAEAEAIGPE